MDPIRDRWLEWERENPTALAGLAMLARQLLAEEHAKGRSPMLSAKLLFELARFRGLLDVTKDEGRRWNNDFTALAARALMRIAPDLTPRIETRMRRAEQDEAAGRVEREAYTGELFA